MNSNDEPQISKGCRIFNDWRYAYYDTISWSFHVFLIDWQTKTSQRFLARLFISCKALKGSQY